MVFHYQTKMNFLPDAFPENAALGTSSWAQTESLNPLQQWALGIQI
jgi:hypothetical protein